MDASSSLSFAALALIAQGWSTPLDGRDGVPDERPAVVAASSDAELAETEASVALLPSQPNLRVVSITHTSYLYPDNTCSIRFHVRVRNSGTASAYGFVVGARGWGTPTIATCTGTWRAINTTGTLAPSQERTIIVNGPGYVGPRVLRGTALTIRGYADTHCAVAESNESDNSRTVSISAGYP